MEEQKQIVIDYYKDIRSKSIVTPTANDVVDVVVYHEEHQTDEMIKYFKSLSPSSSDILQLMYHVKKTQTEDMVDLFTTLSTLPGEIAMGIGCCECLQTDEMVLHYLEKQSLIDMITFANLHIKSVRAIQKCCDGKLSERSIMLLNDRLEALNILLMNVKRS